MKTRLTSSDNNESGGHLTMSAAQFLNNTVPNSSSKDVARGYVSVLRYY